MAYLKNLLRPAIWFTIVLLCCACTATPTAPVLPVNTPTIQEPTALPSASPTLIPPTLTSVPPTKTAVPETATPIPSATPLPSPTRAVKTVVVARENTPVPQPAAPITADNADQVTALALWGNGSANDLAYSPDGNILAVASVLGIYLYDDNSYGLDVIETAQINTSLDFSPDGEILAVGDMDGKITLWRWRKKEIVKVLESPSPNPIRQLTFSPVGDALGFTNDAGTYRDPKLLRVMHIQDGSIFFTSRYDASDFAFSKDGQSVLIPLVGLEQWSLKNGEMIARFEFNLTAEEKRYMWAEISSVALSTNDEFIAGGGSKAYFWKTQDGQRIGFGSPEDVFTFRLYIAPTCKSHIDGGGKTTVTSIDFSPDGRYVALGTNGDEIQIRRVEDNQQMAGTSPQALSFGSWTGISKIRYHPSKPKFVVLHSNGLIEERDAQSAKVLQKIAGHPQAYKTVVISPSTAANQALVAVAASSGIVQIRDLVSGTSRVELGWPANALAFSPDGNTLAAGTEDWKVRMVSLSSGKQIEPLNGHQDQVTGIAYTQNGKVLVSGSIDCTIRFWDVSPSMPQDAADPLSVAPLFKQLAASPDGNWVVILAKNQSFLLKIRKTGDYALEPIAGPNVKIIFSSDSKFLAGTAGNYVDLLEPATGRVLKSWPVDGEIIAFSPDDNLLAVGNQQGDLTLIDTHTSQPLHQFSAHRGEITTLAFSNDGRILISTGADGTVRLWGVAP